MCKFYLIPLCLMKPNGLELVEYGTYDVLPRGTRSPALVPQRSENKSDICQCEKVTDDTTKFPAG
jgi:hypothetical protein